MIYRRGQKVLVQGITGKQATFWASKMIECGTDIVAGVSPKRAGETHLGVPVFKTAVEATRHVKCDVSAIFIPPGQALEAIIDAIDAGVKTIVALTEHIPRHDVLKAFARLRYSDSRIVGPNTAGLVTPGQGFVGIMPGHNLNIFAPGCVGVISRSGSLGTLMCLNLTRAGLGQSAFIGIGGDSIIGTTTRDALVALDEDPITLAVVMVGEIGGSMEEAAAEYARTMNYGRFVTESGPMTDRCGRSKWQVQMLISGRHDRAAISIAACRVQHEGPSAEVAAILTNSR